MKLAQLNIAHAKYPLDHPSIKDFIDNLEIVNAIAEQSEGFIWRLKDDSGDATSIQLFDDPNIIVNMSVWETADSLKDFMFRTIHRDFMRRKKEWFHQVAEDTYVLWWIEDGYIPTPQEAIERLDHLRTNGDTPFAFTFKTNFTAADLYADRHGVS
ncbi:DUF3291 domain-containing protein [Vibrio sp. OCN044]|uniref:DUF3291 domain-containing protein n=1 Tax=Vibrio tetraodonis subsp. pristinus TaxID=2695891 RepID=A0A6L8LQQ7_9VIBR|nr:DUF3291 domain-containing protein [Vibrio tetraodonis]MYM58338.1 DUF3291 domain-containing protein [Vibrio tetraodonis subsp. pristinus]